MSLLLLSEQKSQFYNVKWPILVSSLQKECSFLTKKINVLGQTKLPYAWSGKNTGDNDGCSCVF